MTYNESINLINHAKDLDFEFNIKLLILCSMLLYSLFALYLAHKWESDKYFVKVIKIFLLQIPFGIFLIFLPLFSIFLLRLISYEKLYMLMLSFYSYAFIVMIISAKLGLFEFIAEKLNLTNSTKETKTDLKL